LWHVRAAAALGFARGAIAPGAAALSPTEVADARARHPDKSAQATRALRPATDL
jgi:hypothetical protein